MWRNYGENPHQYIAQERRQRTANYLQCLKTELSKRLSKLEPVVQEYVVPELFTRCHCKRSIKLLVEDKEIYASKQILKLASPVFLSMFESDFREKSMESVELPGKTCQEVVLLLSCLYPNILEQIEDDLIKHEKDVVTKSSLNEAGRNAWMNIESYIYDKTEFQVHNWFGTAKELRDLFDKLHVTSITINRKTGSGTVQFDNTTSALLAYCLDGQVFNGNPLKVDLLNESESYNEILDGISFPNMFEDVAAMDTWQCTKVHFTAQEKILMLLKLADEYQIEAVLRLCGEKYLYWYNESSKDSEEIPADNIIKLLHLAEKYNLKNLCKELSDKAMAIKLKCLRKEPRFEKLSAITRFKICHSKLSKIGQLYDADVREKSDQECFVSKSNITYTQKVENRDFIDGTNPYMTMVIQVGSEKLYASREVLALSSQVLKDKMEAKVDQESLDFPDHNRDDFLCVLRSIHPNFQPTVNRRNAKRLLKLAEEFQLRKLFDDCDAVLDFEFRDLNAKAIQDDNKSRSHYNSLQNTNSTRLKTAQQFLSLAVKYKLPKLQASCCNTLSTMNHRQLMSFVENKEIIPLDVLINVMYPRILKLEEVLPPYRMRSSYKNSSDQDAVEKEMDSDPEPFREQTEYDVCLVVQGENLYIDEDVLALASPFFKRELEKQTSQHGLVVECAGKKIDGIILLLKCIHPNMLAKVNEANALSILQFVEEFEMSALSKVCEDSLIKMCTVKMSAASMVDYIAKAEKYKMNRLRSVCEATLAKMCGESTSPLHATVLGNAALNFILNSHIYEESYSPYYCSSDDSD